MEDLIEGFVLALDPIALLITIAGVAVGVIVGAIPGLSGAMLIALLLPVTFQMEPFYAVVAIIGVYVGSVSGGLITAIMLRLPDTVSNLMTMLDGYPMEGTGMSLWVMLAFGVLGLVMEWLEYPLAPFAIAFVLGPNAEAKLRTGMQMTAGDWSSLYTQPIPLVLFRLAIVIVGASMFKSRKEGNLRNG